MLSNLRFTNANCNTISTTRLIILIQKYNERSYSNSQIIRRNNTTIASNTLPTKLKFISNTLPNENTTTNTNNAQTESSFKFKFINSNPNTNSSGSKSFKWSTHSLPSKETLQKQQENALKEQQQEQEKLELAKKIIQEAKTNSAPIQSNPIASTSSSTALKTKKKKRTLRPRKAFITLSPNAIVHLKALLDQPNPQLIRVGTRNRGCSGTIYDLQYITEPGKFDEVVEQDGVKIVIDSKALFSVVGSEMDWVDNKLQSKFVFKNPNSKGTCGCGESFMV